MKVSVEAHEIKECTIYSNVFFTSGIGIDEMLMRLMLIE